jgi:hypothetical protein
MSMHFTVVSYREDQPMNVATEGNVRFQSFLTDQHNEFDQGTFENSRQELYDGHLGTGRNVQCVISGHTHRRGLYFISRVDRSGRDSIRTRYFDFTSFQSALSEMGTQRRQPAIVVSDSAGPIPRHNARGEFFGWGSSAPSGTQLVFTLNSSVFDVDGELKMVNAIPSSVRPRLAVSLDYMDIVAKREVMPGLLTDAFDPDDENRGRMPRYTFRLALHPQLVRLRIRFAELRILVNDQGTHFEALDLERRSDNEWEISGRAQMRLFSRLVVGGNPIGRFLSVKLASDDPQLLDQYDLDSAWNFEFHVDTVRISNSGVPIIGPLIDLFAGTKKSYHIRRYVNLRGRPGSTPHPRCEKPDFAFRTRFDKYK